MSLRVTVIGGGPAGATIAMLLARAGLDVTVLEGGPKPDWKVGEGLPPSANRLIQALGLTASFGAGGHLPSYGNRSVWGGSAPADLDFITSPYGHGWHLDRTRFDEMLAAAAVQAGARWVTGKKATSAQRQPGGGWSLGLTDETGATATWHAADFVVDATGRRSWFARAAGARRESYDRLVGFACLLRCDEAEDVDSLTLIEAIPEGWWYTALLPGGARMAVFMSDGDLPAAKDAQSQQGWLRLLGESTYVSGRLEGYRQVSGPRRLAANSSRLTRPAGGNWLAVGDAAAAYDPLSSQGILMAMGTANEAAQAVLARARGEEGALAKYTSFLEGVYQEYLSQRDLHYRLERRWPDAPFWARRMVEPTPSKRPALPF